MAARSTPSKGGKPDKLMRDAIMVALKREAVAANGQKTRKLALVADALVNAAIEGDIQAIKEINDRVDGKAPQAITGADDGPVKLIVGWASKSSG